MKQFETREALLQDAIDYFWGKPERKCVNYFGACIYTPSETSEGCAIGRLLPLDLAERLGFDGVSDDEVFYSLPIWLQDMGQDFLTALQICHDKGMFADVDENDLCSRMDEHVNLDKIVFPN